jgi:cell wall-associated NlpC family hydrolase
MGNIHDAVNFALAQQGKPYKAYGARFGPNYYDCSGLMKASCDAAHIITPSSATNSSGFYNWAKAAGTLISADQAIHTYGAMLVRGGSYGYGPVGHIAFSLGDGRTMEAMGRRWGCLIGNAYGRRWGTSMIVPGADYSDPMDVAILKALAAAIQQFRDIPMHKGDKREDLVKFAKGLLNKKMPKAHLDVRDPHFADKMETVVKNFQKLVHLKPDGVIGPKTIDALTK